MSAASQPRDRPGRSRLWVVALLVAAGHPVGVALGGALLLPAVLSGRPQLLALPVGVAVLALLWVAGTDRLPAARAVGPGDEPALGTLVREVAEQLGVGAPILLRIVPGPVLEVTAQRFAGVRGYAVDLGWPLLRRLDSSQLAAVVGSRLGQAHHADLADRWLTVARAALSDSLRRPVHLPTAVVVRLLRTTRPARWQAVHAADAAALACGDLPGGLLHMATTRAAFDVLGPRWADALAARDAFPGDLYAALAAAQDDPHTARELLAIALTDELPAGPAAVDPPLARRLAGLGMPGTGADPVSLQHSAELQLWCEQELVRVEGWHALRPGTVLGVPAEVLDGAHSGGLTRATGQPGRAAISAALWHVETGTWPLLAARLDPAGAPSRAAFVEGLSRALFDELTLHGWTRASRWTTRAVVDSAGQVVDLDRTVLDAMATADTAAVRGLLGSAGLRASA